MKNELSHSTVPEPLRPSIVGTDEFQRVIEKLSENIARRTRQLSRSRHRDPSLPDWMQAEAELLRPVPVRIIETNSSIKVVAEVPGFAGRDLRVAVEPRRLLIIGRAGAELVGSITTARRILRLVALPDPVSTSDVTVELKEDALEIVLRRDMRGAHAGGCFTNGG